MEGKKRRKISGGKEAWRSREIRKGRMGAPNGVGERNEQGQNP
jgi:hypothetical protein